MTDLERLHIEIGQCEKCAEICELKKNANLKRGTSSDLMVIGLSPGNVESKSGNAFSGQAGTRLFSWLQQAGIGKDEDEIRTKLYFTSVIKCQQTQLNVLSKMYRNCEPFLRRQTDLVKPQIAITLGAPVFNILFSTNFQNGDIVGTCISHDAINSSPLFPEMDTLYGITHVLPFPHPSGLSRWLNGEKNKATLGKAIELLKSLYHEEDTEH